MSWKCVNTNQQNGNRDSRETLRRLGFGRLSCARVNQPEEGAKAQGLVGEALEVQPDELCSRDYPGPPRGTLACFLLHSHR